jgi:hypothetical protein
MKDILLVEGLNELSVQLVPIALPFDPWSYDVNGNGVIETSEMLAAANDYNAGIITKAQLDQVTALWEATKPPPPPPPECATQAQKDQAVADWQAGLITTQELLRIQNLPLCT